MTSRYNRPRGEWYTETKDFHKQFAHEEKYEESSSSASTNIRQEQEKNKKEMMKTQQKKRQLSISSYRPRSPTQGGSDFFNNRQSHATPGTEVQPFVLSPEASFESKYGEAETSSPVIARGFDLSLETNKRHSFWDRQDIKEHRIEDCTEELKMAAETSCVVRSRTMASGWVTSESRESLEQDYSSVSSSSSSSSADESTPSTSSSAAEEDEEERRSFSEGKEKEEDEKENEDKDKDSTFSRNRDLKGKVGEEEEMDKKDEETKKKTTERRREKRKRKKEKRKKKPHAPIMPRPPSPSSTLVNKNIHRDRRENGCENMIRAAAPPPASPVCPMQDPHGFEEKEQQPSSTNQQEESKYDISNFSHIPAELPTFKTSSKEKITLDMLNVLRPFRTTQMIHCLLRRTTKGVMGKLHPTYSLYLQEEH